MKIVTALAVVVLLLAGHPALASDDTAATLAGILAGMQHFPSEQQKAELADIAGDQDVAGALRTIAAAIGDIAHQVPDAEREKLNAIVTDSSSTDAEKTLAGAALRFKHHVASEDAAALQSLAK